MEVDEDQEHSMARHSGINSLLSGTQTLGRRTPNTIGFVPAATKNVLNQARRSSSGIFITSMFGSRFRHLQKLHTEAFLGLNAVCLPGLPVGAVFRSSLPATPVATPLYQEAFQQFSEQAIRDRLCKTPSPRKNHRSFGPFGGQQMDTPTNAPGLNAASTRYESHEYSDVQPMDMTSPTSPIPEPVPEVSKEEENQNNSAFGGEYFDRNAGPTTSSSSDVYHDKRLFVGNISYRVGSHHPENPF